MPAHPLSEKRREALTKLLGRPFCDLEQMPLGEAKAAIEAAFSWRGHEERKLLREAIRYLESRVVRPAPAIPVAAPTPTPRDRMVADKARLLEEALKTEQQIADQMGKVRDSIADGAKLVDGLRQGIDALMRQTDDVYSRLRVTSVRLPRTPTLAARLDSDLGGMVAHLDSSLIAGADRVFSIQSAVVDALMGRRKNTDLVAAYDDEILRALGVIVERDVERHSASFDEIFSDARRAGAVEPALIGEGDRVIKRGKVFRAAVLSPEETARPTAAVEDAGPSSQAITPAPTAGAGPHQEHDGGADSALAATTEERSTLFARFLAFVFGSNSEPPRLTRLIACQTGGRSAVSLSPAKTTRGSKRKRRNP